jgi:hypothetical protein
MNVLVDTNVLISAVIRDRLPHGVSTTNIKNMSRSKDPTWPLPRMRLRVFESIDCTSLPILVVTQILLQFCVKTKSLLTGHQGSKGNRDSDAITAARYSVTPAH